MIQKFSLAVLVLLNVLTLQAQDFRINLFGGMANYAGDLQEKSITFQQSRYAFGLWGSYDYSDKLMLRAGAHYAQINASDRFQTAELRRLRNLSFATNILEFHAAGEYHFLGMSSRVFSPYLMGGVAVFHTNPFVYTTTGTKLFLKPFSTEGQGLVGFPDRKEYKLTQLALPFGAGVRMTLTDRIDVGAEFSYRKTFTDYIDDVSGTYVDELALLTQKGPLAVQLAFRTPELPGHTFDTYPVANSQRGGKSKDNYYFFGVTLTYRITGGSSNGNGVFNSGGRGSKRKSNMGCPTNVL